MVGKIVKDANIQLLANELNDHDPKVRDAATNKLLSIAAVIYKTYMDELYYSGDYRKPKNAVLFNAYLASYQRITGAMASIGCKSANDRTYVVRLIISALNGQKLNALPPNLHGDEAEFNEFRIKEVTPRVETNSAIHSCIDDTAGGLPKVDSKKFKYLKNVKFIDLLSDFGDFAAHKLKSMLSSFITAYKKHLLVKPHLNPKHPEYNTLNRDMGHIFGSSAQSNSSSKMEKKERTQRIRS